MEAPTRNEVHKAISEVYDYATTHPASGAGRGLISLVMMLFNDLDYPARLTNIFWHLSGDNRTHAIVLLNARMFNIATRDIEELARDFIKVGLVKYVI